MVIPLSFEGIAKPSTHGLRLRSWLSTTGSGGSVGQAPSCRLRCSNGSTWCGVESGGTAAGIRVAKAIVVASHSIALSWWSPIAYLWQDAAVVLAFAAVEFCLGSRVRAAWALYAVLALYAAINIPVARVLSTPLTWPMLRAAGGPLADSIWHYATLANFLALGAVLAVRSPGTIHLRGEYQTAARAGARILCVILGPVAAAQVDTLGLERNAWTRAGYHRPAARVASRQPLTTGEHRDRSAAPHEELSRFHGAAAGRNVVLMSLESTAAQYLGLYGADPDAHAEPFRSSPRAASFRQRLRGLSGKHQRPVLDSVLDVSGLR